MNSRKFVYYSSSIILSMIPFIGCASKKRKIASTGPKEYPASCNAGNGYTGYLKNSHYYVAGQGYISRPFCETYLGPECESGYLDRVGFLKESQYYVSGKGYITNTYCDTDFVYNDQLEDWFDDNDDGSIAR